MIEISISEVMERLNDLAAYSQSLSAGFEHEEGLPENAVPFLIEKLQAAYLACSNSTPANQAHCAEELCKWLSKSYRFYLLRLEHADNPWCFRFPKAGGARRSARMPYNYVYH